jgi:thiol-disulfide isomerase/thioredoxin
MEKRVRLKFLLLLALPLWGCDRNSSKPDSSPASAEAPAARVASAEKSAGRLDRSHAGTAAPGAVFLDPTGEPASLQDFRGKPLLLNLWATWCAPCVAEMPTLDALAGSRDDIEVLTVSQDMAGKAKVDAFFAKRNFRMIEPYLDAELSLMTGLKVDTLPTTILYDAEGREVWRMTGMEDWKGSRAASLIGEALR